MTDENPKDAPNISATTMSASRICADIDLGLPRARGE